MMIDSVSTSGMFGNYLLGWSTHKRERYDVLSNSLVLSIVLNISHLLHAINYKRGPVLWVGVQEICILIVFLKCALQTKDIPEFHIPFILCSLLLGYCL